MSRRFDSLRLNVRRRAAEKMKWRRSRHEIVQAIISLDAVSIIGSTFAVVFGEPAKGGRDKYLLSES